MGNIENNKVKNTATKPKISIIIVNYKTDELILDLLKGLKNDNSIEIIVVDNSPKNTLKKNLPVRDDLKYYFTGKNLGFSGGNNYGISRAKGEWLFLLNSDTKTTTEDILELLKKTEKSGYLVSAPKLVQPDKQIQDNVGYFDNYFQNLINAIFARPRKLNCSGVKKPLAADYLTGAAMLVHRSVFDRAGFLDDKHYFMYFEDIDFSQRLHKSGFKVLYLPDIKIVHYGGASSDQDSRQKNINYQNGLNTYLKIQRGPLIATINKVFHVLQ